MSKALKLTMENYRMKDKELLLEAIDNYDVYSPQARALLKTMVIAAREDNTIQISVKNLYELSKISKQGAYNALRSLGHYGMIEKIRIPGQRLSFFKLSAEKLSGILNYYHSLKETKAHLRKI
jgi:CTP-dependent riboflavin kinase